MEQNRRTALSASSAFPRQRWEKAESAKSFTAQTERDMLGDADMEWNGTSLQHPTYNTERRQYGTGNDIIFHFERGKKENSVIYLVMGENPAKTIFPLYSNDYSESRKNLG